MNKKKLCALAVLSGLSFSAMALDCDPNLLPSWQDGTSKTAIVNYVDQSTDTSKKPLFLNRIVLLSSIMMEHYGLKNLFIFNLYLR